VTTSRRTSCHDPAYQYVSNHDIRARAEQHGYAIAEFFVGRVASRRPGSWHLRARGIEGLIVSPHRRGVIGSQLDFGPFAAATFGYGLQSPALHRASTNMTQGILMAVAKLRERGYARIGLAVTHWIDARSDHTTPARCCTTSSRSRRSSVSPPSFSRQSGERRQRFFAHG